MDLAGISEAELNKKLNNSKDKNRLSRIRNLLLYPTELRGHFYDSIRFRLEEGRFYRTYIRWDTSRLFQTPTDELRVQKGSEDEGLLFNVNGSSFETKFYRQNSILQTRNA